MEATDFGDVVYGSLLNLWNGVVEFIPALLIAILLFIVGWIVATILGKAIAEIVERLKLDDVLRSAGLEKVSRRAGFNLSVAGFIGGLIKWFIIIVFLIAALDVLGLAEVNTFLNQIVVDFLPDVVVAVFILLAGAVVAEAVQNIVIGSARSAGLKSAHFLGVAARWAIWIFAGLAALSQLGVAAVFIQTFFTGIIIAAALAFGLAFGLGGRDAAGRYIEYMRDQLSHRETSDTETRGENSSRSVM